MSKDTESEETSVFECPICLQVAKTPVVTLCGHLYCWQCLTQWFQSQQGTPACPVCKADLQDGKIIPIYCRGSESSNTKEMNLPPRPRPLLQTAAAEVNTSHFNPPHQIYQHDEPYQGVLYTVFGISGGSHGAPMTSERQHQAFLTRLLLLLGSFVILCLLLF